MDVSQKTRYATIKLQTRSVWWGKKERILSHRLCIRRSTFAYIVWMVYTVYRYLISLLPIFYVDSDHKTRKNDEESGFLTFAVVLHFHRFIRSRMVWSHVCIWNKLRNKLKSLWPSHMVRNHNITSERIMKIKSRCVCLIWSPNSIVGLSVHDSSYFTFFYDFL